MANAETIYILNKYDEVIGGLSNSLPEACPYYEDMHHEQLENGYEIFELKTPIFHPSGSPDLIQQENKLLIRDMDGGFRLFRIKKVTDNTITKEKIIFSEAESIEMFNDPVRPLTISGSPKEIMNAVLNPSRWEPGVIETAATNELVIEEYTSVLAAVHAAADLYDLEIRFRIEWDGSTITGRYVDLLQRLGNPTGTFFEYNHDIEGLTRTKDSMELATALIGVGKSDEAEQATTFESISWSVAAGNPADKPLGQDWVGDPDALAQFGVDGRHIFRTVTFSEEADPERLLAATWDELQRRIKGSVEYEVDLVLLEKIAGYSHKAVRKGDTITIKDTSFATPLVLEARVLEIKRSKTDPTKDEVVLGEYRERELTESELIRQLQMELAKKSAAWEAGGGIEVVEQPTPPADPVDGLYWLDTSKTPNIWKRWDAVTGSWIPATPERADQLVYSDGRTVQSLQPAQAGADITSQNTAADTQKVAGTAASTVSSGAAAGSTANQKIQAEVGSGTIETTAGSTQKAAPGTAANNKIQAEVGTGTIETTARSTAKSGPVSTVAPSNPQNGDKWVDISTPGLEVWKRFNSTTGLWEEIGRTSFNEITGTIVQGQVGIGAIGNQQLADLAVTLAKIGDNAVNANKISDGAVTGTKIGTDAVTNDKLANGSVGVNEIVDKAISTAKIALAAITNGLMATAAVGTDQLIADSVTSAKILAATIQGGDIAGLTITGGNMVANTLTAGQIAADTITAAQIAANAITATELAADSVTSAKILANTILAGDIAANTITASQVAANTITASQVAADTLTAAQIAANAITSSEIAANTIVAGDIAANTITGSQIAARTIGAGHIIANSITAAEIAANTITASQIAAGTITTNLIAATGLSANVIKGGTIQADVLFAGALVGATGSFSGTLDAATGTFAGIVTSSELLVDDGNSGRLRMRMAPGYDANGNILNEDLFVVMETSQSAAAGSLLSFFEEWYDAGSDSYQPRSFDTVDFNTSFLRVTGYGNTGQIQAWRLHADDGGIWSDGPLLWNTAGNHIQVNGWDPIFKDHANGNVSISAMSGDIYVGYYHTSGIRFLAPMKSDIDMGGFTITTTGRSWVAPTFQNGAANFGSGYENAGYYKDALGFIHIKGMIRPVTATGSIIFTLPVGYRPSGRRIFACYSSSGAAVRVDIDANGNVYQMGGSVVSTGYLSLEGIVFNT